jgi:L-2-hydroxyglutarate oxidase LhgO
METTDCIVVGAGVVGLAVARTLAAAGREVLLLEAEHRIGEHTSSRNSEVIHAGLYYKPGSLRQHLLPRGAHLMYAYCAEHGVPHKRLGKLVVARQKDEYDRLHHHMQHAIDAGVEGIEWLDSDQARELEPNLSCYAAFLSPNSGIVDSHALMLAYQGELESHGGRLVLRAPVTGGEVMSNGIRVEVGGAEPTRPTARCRWRVRSRAFRPSSCRKTISAAAFISA